MFPQRDLNLGGGNGRSQAFVELNNGGVRECQDVKFRAQEIPLGEEGLSIYMVHQKSNRYTVFVRSGMWAGKYRDPYRATRASFTATLSAGIVPGRVLMSASAQIVCS